MNSPLDGEEDPNGDRPDIWEAAARKLSANPDSPEALRLLSALNKSLAPLTRASEQLVEALADQQLSPGPQSLAGVDAAIAHWERTAGGRLDADTLAIFVADAGALLDQRKRQPPPLESIMGEQVGRTDYAYSLGVGLEGLHGTWHRLWAALVLEGTLGGDVAGVLRTEFEQLLGRSMSALEWQALAAHAQRRVDELNAARSG